MTIKSAVLRSVPAPFLPIVQRIQASPFGYRLAKGAFWSLAGTVVSRGLALLSWIWIARLLGRTDFGKVGMIQNTVGLFGSFAGLGLGLTATRYVSEFRGKYPERAGRIIAFSGLMATATGLAASIALYALAPWLAGSMLKAPELAPMLRIGVGVLFFGTLNGAQTGALSGFEAFRTIAAINLACGVSAVPLMLGGAWLDGVRGVVTGLSISMAVNWLLNHLALRKEAAAAGIPLLFAKCWEERTVLWSFSVPVVLNGLMVAPVSWICLKMLADRPGGYGEIGLYTSAIQWQTALGFLPALLAQVLLPMLSDSHSNEDPAVARQALMRGLLVFMAVILLPAAALFAASPWITGLYGGDFHMPVRLFVAILGFATLSNIGTALYTCLLSRNRAWYGFLGNSICGVCVVLSFYYLQKWGAFGLALANVVSYLAAMTVIFPPILRSLFAQKAPLKTC